MAEKEDSALILLLFFLHLCKYLDEFKSLSNFISCLHDKDKGRCYRTYAGIPYDRIPCEYDFSHFKNELSQKSLMRSSMS